MSKSQRNFLSTLVDSLKKHPVWVALTGAAACTFAGFGLKQQLLGALEDRVISLEKAHERVATEHTHALQDMKRTNDALETRISTQDGLVAKLTDALSSLQEGKASWGTVICRRLVVTDPVSGKERVELKVDPSGIAGLVVADDKGRRRIQVSTRDSHSGSEAAEIMVFDGVTPHARHEMHADADGHAFHTVRSSHGLDIYSLVARRDEQPLLTVGDIHGASGQILKFGVFSKDGKRQGVMLLDQENRRAVLIGDLAAGKFGVGVEENLPINKKFPVTKPPITEPATEPSDSPAGESPK